MINAPLIDFPTPPKNAIKSDSQRELRLVLTEKCNYQCTFCHKEGLQGGEQERLDSQDYSFLFHLVKNHFGINDVTLTGGEPLIRSDIFDIVHPLKKKGAKVTVVSNGALLHKKLWLGAYVDRFNISMHTLDKQKYANLVGPNHRLEDVIKGIEKLSEYYPGVEIRLNTTFMHGLNAREEDILTYIDFAQKYKASIKYVELYPHDSQGFVSLEVLERLLIQMGFVKTETSRKIHLTMGPLKIILTKIVCSEAQNKENPGSFCGQNSDLYVTPDGRFQLCRNGKEYVDIHDTIKARDEVGSINRIRQALDTMGNTCRFNKLPASRDKDHAYARI